MNLPVRAARVALFAVTVSVLVIGAPLAQADLAKTLVERGKVSSRCG
jgi:hypothetical protein